MSLSGLFDHRNVFCIKAPNLADLSGDSDILKQQLAEAFEVNLERLVETLKQHKYILTFDVRLLLCKCCLSVVCSRCFVSSS
jgi:hypothetical protein